MTTSEHVESPATRSSSPTKRPWTVTTVLWSTVAAVIPLNYALPPVPRALWFCTIMALICASVVLMRMARPLFTIVWTLAGCASLAATLTATNAATIADNLFVGAQLLALLGFGVFVLTFNTLNDPRFVQRLSAAFLVGQTLSSAVAVSQLLDHPIHVPGTVFGAVWGRAAGLTEAPNTFGLMSCVGVLLAVAILVMTTKFRIVVLVALSANLLGILASGSLSALLALASGMLVLIVCKRDSLGRMALWGGAFVFAATVGLASGVAGFLSYLPSITDRYMEVTGQAAGGSSLEVRKLTYDFAWKSIADDPIFGQGLSNKASGTYDGVIGVHNALLRAWYQGGILLAAAFALIMLGMLLAVTQAMIRKDNGCEAGILLATLVYAAVSPLLEQRQIWLPALVAWGSISAGRVCQKHSDRTAGRLTTIGRP